MIQTSSVDTVKTVHGHLPL